MPAKPHQSPLLVCFSCKKKKKGIKTKPNDISCRRGTKERSVLTTQESGGVGGKGIEDAVGCHSPCPVSQLLWKSRLARGRRKRRDGRGGSKGKEEENPTGDTGSPSWLVVLWSAQQSR